MSEPKKGKTVLLSDGTEISQEELDKMDDTRSWSKVSKKSVLGQKR